MYGQKGLCCIQYNLFNVIRNLTSTEVSSALRPFYFTVHPDLFGKHPQERAINENSLQQLSSLLQTLQASKPLSPTILPFYMKERSSENGKVRLIRVSLAGRDIGTAVVNILKACNLPTSHLQHLVNDNLKTDNSKIRSENIRYTDKEWKKTKYENEFDFTKVDKNHPLYATFGFKQKMEMARENLRLRYWLEANHKDALEKCRTGAASIEEISKLKRELIETYKMQDIRWDCGWNNQHFRGCLLAFKSLMEQHSQQMRNLQNQIVVFSYFTGINLDGHIMLFSGEVRHNWLDFLKNIKKYKSALGRVPYYEKSLSHVLRNIKVSRRKFMPEMKVGEYESNLKQLTTSVSDYFGRNKYPKDWPKVMDSFEIVVESEAGPMMVSPTGQFIVPSSIPGSNLISFLSSNLREADLRAKNYKHDKIMERTLHQKCILELGLAELIKDDNITPELMIQCCQVLLDNSQEIKIFTKSLHVRISNYYSVLSDGVVCIPWNFKL